MAISDFLLNPTTLAELAAFVAATLLLLQYKNGYWRFFIIYCGVLLLCELGGFYLRTVVVKPNHVLYNLLMLLQAVFFLYLLRRFHFLPKLKKYIGIATIVFLLLYVTESVVHLFDAYNKISRQFLALEIVLFCCTFYFTLLQNDRVKNPLTYPPFWIVTGLFVYYFGTFVIFVFYNEVSKIKLTGSLSFYTIIIGSLSAILYGCWIIGFIWKRKQLQSF